MKKGSLKLENLADSLNNYDSNQSDERQRVQELGDGCQFIKFMPLSRQKLK